MAALLGIHSVLCNSCISFCPLEPAQPWRLRHFSLHPHLAGRVFRPSLQRFVLEQQRLRFECFHGGEVLLWGDSRRHVVGMVCPTLGSPRWQEMELDEDNMGAVESKGLEQEGQSNCRFEIDAASSTGMGGVVESDPLGASRSKGYKSTAIDDVVLPVRQMHGKYDRELEIALRAVQLACSLTQRSQERLIRKEEMADAKTDRSLVTVADWGVQAVVSWVLSQSFGGEKVSMIAEEDTLALKGLNGIEILQRVVSSVNECLSFASFVGLNPPDHPLGTLDVLKAINKGNSPGGPTGRHWVLDPVDGTLGFVRGDQYAIALAMIEDGEVALGVLGCPNLPTKREWLNYHHRYYRLISKLSPPQANVWHKGCILTAQKGVGKAWMQPLAWNANEVGMLKLARPVSVSSIDDPADATFCEPVEKGNSSHSFTAGLASSIGLKRRPLRVYSMVKYAAIARGDAEIFMKFAKAGYKEKIWDHAAGVLIVQEAGGVVTDARGKPLEFSKGRYIEGLDRGIIACSGKKLHEKLIEAVDVSWDSSQL